MRFVDTFIRLNERGEPWTLSPYQRQVLALAFRWTADGYLDGLRYLLWSEPKKSGKTLLAAVLVAWGAFTRSRTEVVVVANGAEK